METLRPFFALGDCCLGSNNLSCDRKRIIRIRLMDWKHAGNKIAMVNKVFLVRDSGVGREEEEEGEEGFGGEG